MPDITIPDAAVEALRTARARGLRPEAPHANLRGANLRGADLRGADLRGANLSDANLWGADLWGARADILTIPCGIPSGLIALTPTPDGWTLRVGCWTGTVDTLRALIASDTGWPEATGTEIARRRPILAALADLCDAHIAYHADIVPALAKKWGAK